MRLCGSTKFAMPASTALVPYRPSKAGLRDCFITWLDRPSGLSVITVPPNLPPIILIRSRNKSKSKSKKNAVTTDDLTRAKVDPFYNDYVECRMNELVKVKVHPSAFHDRSHGVEDAFDPAIGVKFNFTDRSEPCFSTSGSSGSSGSSCPSGSSGGPAPIFHEGNINFRCFVDDNNDVYVKCYSTKCSGAKPTYLGPLEEEYRPWLSTSSPITLEFLNHIIQRMTQAAAMGVEDCVDDDSELFEDALAALKAHAPAAVQVLQAVHSIYVF